MRQWDGYRNERYLRLRILLEVAPWIVASGILLPCGSTCLSFESLSLSSEHKADPVAFLFSAHLPALSSCLICLTCDQIAKVKRFLSWNDSYAWSLHVGHLYTISSCLLAR